MKKVGKYLTITSLLLLGLFCVGLLFLFFVPKSNLFGIVFISYNQKETSQKFEANSVNKIIVQSRSYNVEVKSTKQSDVYLTVENHSLGYVLEKNSKLDVFESYENNELTFIITEPYGAAFKNNSTITLHLPTSKEFDLSLTNKNALTKINDSYVKINDLYYSSQKGNFTIKNASLTGLIDLNLNDADFKLSSNATLNYNNVQIKVTTGKFDASSSSKLGDVTIKSNKRGVILINECFSLNQSARSSGGRIEASLINTVNFSSTDTNLYIKHITEGAIINLTNSGKVEINTLLGTSDILTNKGSVYIINSFSEATILTSSGDVKIKNATSRLFVTTNSGNISVSFPDTIEQASNTNPNVRFLKVITNTGNVHATGLNRADIESKENSSIDLTFSSTVYSNSSIKTNKGSVFVKVDKNSQYMLNSKTTSGSVRVNLTQTEVYNGWTNQTLAKAINCVSSTNSINLETISASILMLDSNFY